MLVYLRDGSVQTVLSNMLVYLRDGSAQTILSNMLVYLRDGSALTILSDMLVYLRDRFTLTIFCAATLRQKLQTKVSISPSHSIHRANQFPAPVISLLTWSR